MAVTTTLALPSEPSQQVPPPQIAAEPPFAVARFEEHLKKYHGQGGATKRRKLFRQKCIDGPTRSPYDRVPHFPGPGEVDCSEPCGPICEKFSIDRDLQTYSLIKVGLEKAFKQLGVKHAEAHKTAAMYVVDLHGGEPDRDYGAATFLYLATAMAQHARHQQKIIFNKCRVLKSSTAEDALDHAGARLILDRKTVVPIRLVGVPIHLAAPRHGRYNHIDYTYVASHVIDIWKETERCAKQISIRRLQCFGLSADEFEVFGVHEDIQPISILIPDDGLPHAAATAGPKGQPAQHQHADDSFDYLADMRGGGGNSSDDDGPPPPNTAPKTTNLTPGTSTQDGRVDHWTDDFIGAFGEEALDAIQDELGAIFGLCTAAAVDNAMNLEDLRLSIELEEEEAKHAPSATASGAAPDSPCFIIDSSTTGVHCFIIDRSTTGSCFVATAAVAARRSRNFVQRAPLGGPH